MCPLFENRLFIILPHAVLDMFMNAGSEIVKEKIRVSYYEILILVYQLILFDFVWFSGRLKIVSPFFYWSFD